MDEKEIKALNREYTLFPYTEQRYAQADVYDHAEGIYIYDVEGRCYVDLSSQFINVNIGYGNQKVINAAIEQMKKLHYIKPESLTDVRGELCRKIICEIAPPDMKKIFLTLGGSDANDFAVRIAKAVTGKRKILSQYYSYHGATIGAANLCGDHERIYEKLENRDFIHFMGYNSKALTEYVDEEKYCDFLLKILEETILLEDPNSIAAIFYETISLGNIVVPEQRYYEGVRKLCDKYDILLIFDEVLVGFGRTGKWFACEHYQVQPDIITFAKGVTSAYVPLGGVMVNKKIADKLEKVRFSATLTGSYHPVSCATAIATIDYMIENDLIANAEKMGVYLKEQLNTIIMKHPYVAEVRGIGLLQSIIFQGKMDTRSAAIAFSKMMRERGYIIYVDQSGLLLAPPLIINKEQIDDVIADIESMLNDLEENKYMERLEYYPEFSYDSEYFYTLEFMNDLDKILCHYDKILLLGSANVQVLKMILSNLLYKKVTCKLYLSKTLYTQLDKDTQSYCVYFNDDRFDVNRQRTQLNQIAEAEDFDCVLLPYMRVDEDWGNIYEVAQVIQKPIFRITRYGKIIEE